MISWGGGGKGHSRYACPLVAMQKQGRDHSFTFYQTPVYLHFVGMHCAHSDTVNPVFVFG